MGAARAALPERCCIDRLPAGRKPRVPVPESGATIAAPVDSPTRPALASSRSRSRTPLPEVREDLALVLKAAAFAAERHRRQRRKDLHATPYINHPLALASVLAVEAGVSDPEVLAAALLHDTLEDTETTLAELREAFGERVASIVEEVSDEPGLPDHERRQRQVDGAARLSPGARLVKLADKIANLRDVAERPPHAWGQSRKRDYFDWTARVVAGLEGTHPVLEALFAQAQQRRP